MSDELFQEIEQFTCCMYIPNSSTVEVNELRYQLFCAKRGEVESSQLPPCRDCLFMHIQRANYQAAIWKCCVQATPVVPSPTEYGWTEDGGKLAIYWMRSLPAPDVVLELLTCKCVRSCKSQPVHACQMASHAQTCASYRPAVTKNCRRI